MTHCETCPYPDCLDTCEKNRRPGRPSTPASRKRMREYMREYRKKNDLTEDNRLAKRRQREREAILSG
jgi:hypothetical protein